MKGHKGYVVIILILAVIILTLLTLSIFFQRTLQMEMAEQFNKQQLLLANVQASSIQDYLRSLKEETLHVAQSISQFHAAKDTELKFITGRIFRDTALIKKRVEVLDRRGSVLFSRGNVHAEGPDEEMLVKKAVRSCPGTILMEQDTRTITMTAPLCRLDTFTGVVVLSVDIQDVAKSFLGSLRSATRETAWMMDEAGNLLYHPTQPNMVGRNLHRTDSSCFKCHKTFEAERRIIEGKGKFCTSDYYGRYVAATGEDKILAYSSTMAGDMRWIVAVSAPYSEVTLSIKRSMKFYAWMIVLIAMTTSGVSAWLIVMNQQRKQAEERARHEKELEMMHAEKLSSLERLTSGITSEIGNPLTSVFSFIRVLMDMEDDEFKKETLETIFLHVNRIEHILKQLSGFSRTPIELKPCKVSTIIADSLSLIQYDKRVQGITIVRDLMPDIPAFTTDMNQLSQVIVNLVLNAADAMPKGGTLTIRSRKKDGSIIIEFEDTGVGIEPEDLGKIFDPFYTTKEGGTGLGLAVCYSIIKQLNGDITAESEPGKGSKFVITLPLA